MISRTLPALLLPPLLLLAMLPGQGGGQELKEIRVSTSHGVQDPGIRVSSPRGFASFPARELARLGWEVAQEDGRVLARWGGGVPEVEVRAGTPYLAWAGEGVHLAQAPFSQAGEVYLPVQFLSDVLPWKLPGVFRWEEATGTLELLPPGEQGLPTGGLASAVGRAAGVEGSAPGARGVRVVVIDAGHGGKDPGAKGPGGTQEKDVALGIAEALGRILKEDPGLEVHLTRETDELIPLWQRGELATTWKGDRPGIFVSIHANALPNSRSTRGFETYFLSEARTEHERRVVALENAAMELEERGGGGGQNPDLSFILTELRNLDHQHWSALLADMIQRQLAQFHPGSNRGVKQGPLAVITNALMPAALVEVGFISNPEEERLLKRESFQEESAQAIAAAIQEFFRRYPPAGGGGGEEGVRR